MTASLALQLGCTRELGERNARAGLKELNVARDKAVKERAGD